MTKRRILVVCTIALVSLSFWAGQSFGQIPQLINYQGVLTDPATGNGLTGTYSITFSIYDAATGGTALWTETQSVTAANGLFNVLLGSATAIPLSLFDGSDRYLGVKVGTDPEMTPRQKLVSVGYAFRADNTNKFSGKDTSDFVQSGQENSITTEMVQNNAITAAKVQPKILSSLNNVSHDGGNVDLVAGSNVTITPDDENNRITISAAGGGGGDNLGDHTATQNLKMNGHWISSDGDNEGVFVQRNGLVNIGIQSQTAPYAKLYVQKESSSDTWQHGITTRNPNLQTDQNLMISIGKNSLTKNMGNIYFRYNGNQSNSNRLSFGLKGVNDVLNITANGRVGIGVNQPTEKLDVAGTVKMTGFKLTTGASSGKVLSSDASGNGTWQTVSGDNLGNHTATQNIKLDGHWLSGDGGNEGIYVTKTSGKVGVGTSTPGSNFAAIGSARIGAASNSATGTYAIAMGEGCGAGDAVSIAIGKSCAASAAYAVAIGRNATANNINCVSAGYYCNAYGNPSVAIGSKIAVGGSYSVGIGLDNTHREVTASHVLAIMGGKVGIGYLNPAYTLDVNGTARVGGFSMQSGAGAGKVLTSDASGDGTWQTPPAADNLGNHTATQNIKLNGHWLSGDGGDEGVFVANNGKVGIGNSAPNYALHIKTTNSNDQIRFESAVSNGNPSIYVKAINPSGGHAQIFMDRASDWCESAVNFYDNGTKKWRIIMPDKTTGAGDRLDIQSATGSSVMTFLQNGKVGIGTKNPGNILTIQQGSSTDPIADAWTTYSSRRWKTNIHEIENALTKVTKLRGVSFNWKKDNKADIGLIAEEVGEIFPEIVTYEDNGKDARGLDYSRLIAVLVEAVKEQQKEIQKLKQKLGLD